MCVTTTTTIATTTTSNRSPDPVVQYIVHFVNLIKTINMSTIYVYIHTYVYVLPIFVWYPHIEHNKWFQGTKKLKAHGIGVHSAEEIEEFGKNDLKVLSEMLDCKPFFFGDEPTTLDVVAFAVLSQLHYLSKDIAYPLRDYMTEKCPNLIGHVSRMKDKCFPDWDEICTKLDLNAHIPKPE